jgi:hypothetical protein
MRCDAMRCDAMRCGAVRRCTPTAGTCCRCISASPGRVPPTFRGTERTAGCAAAMPRTEQRIPTAFDRRFQESFLVGTARQRAIACQTCHRMRARR